MRALVRIKDGEKEVYLERDWNEFTKNHLAYMTDSETDENGNTLKGDGWTLVNDYEPEVE